MPSMHVAWAVLFAVAVILATRTAWRWLAVVYPAVTTSVVVVTGNHYWLDGIVGVLLLAVAVTAVAVATPAPDPIPATPVGAGPNATT
jgi:membrane-associated phospholipid phosphatase